VLARAILLATLALPFAAGCSGGSSYPEPAPCPTATAVPPTPTRGGPPGGSTVARYLNAIQNGVNRISQLREVQRNAHPDDSFSRKPEFRTQFAAYADDTICTAEGLQALKPPDTRFAEFDGKLDEVLQALIDHMLTGRAAVGKRNVSDYHAWYKDVDAKIEAVHVVYDARPR
jgi:hypothetical protein